MNSSAEAIVAANNFQNFSAAVLQPILIPVSERPVLTHPLYNTTSSAEQRPKSHRIIVIVLATVGAVLALAMGCLLVISYCKSNHKKVLARMGSTFETIDLLRCKKPSNAEAWSPRTVADKMLPGVSQYLDKLVVFETKAIMKATTDLEERYRIGGSVYRITLNGQVLAAKQAKGDVSEELKILHKVNHSNLVKLAGVSTDADGNVFFLIYEYAEKGSLDKWLYLKPPPLSDPSCSVTFLSWRQRLNIALDVANGLHYMHEHTTPSFVHGSVRSSRILLNSRLKAKISNFSTVKPATAGLTPATDVFAFGVVLLELLSGKRQMSSGEGDDEMEIRMILEGEENKVERIRKWMDPSLEGSYPMDGALSFAALARACTSDMPTERPSMAEIVFSLSLLAHSCTDAFERSGKSKSEEDIQIINPLMAR